MQVMPFNNCYRHRLSRRMALLMLFAHAYTMKAVFCLASVSASTFALLSLREHRHGGPHRHGLPEQGACRFEWTFT
jgi:hypothetical protein